MTAEDGRTDVLTAEQRHLNMSRIRGKDTKPELQLRRLLHAAGLRYRLHGKKLPGSPDLVFPRYRAVVFVHGCFWHRHLCPLFHWPKSREDFWHAKLTRNVERDRQTEARLLEAGWRVLTVWECALRGRLRLPEDEVVRQVRAWLEGDDVSGGVSSLASV
ncbi:very short patch repair endonuclease [uncultured Deinococcus sp.]|uniref:very short patch repair endonuclease n=1 Tax=uncultured Deinococcus sp. TaxID=158789 RepID=UPI0025D496E2|nr:very short patch repair endonuclease [uncultured Deinococcus sp.]